MDKENFVINKPQACNTFQSQFYRPSLCRLCFLKKSEHIKKEKEAKAGISPSKVETLEVSRDLGLTREKSARLFRKLSQRSLVLDMVDDYEKKEKIRSDKLSPMRANTCGPLPTKHENKKPGWHNRLSMNLKNKQISPVLVPNVTVTVDDANKSNTNKNTNNNNKNNNNNNSNNSNKEVINTKANNNSNSNSNNHSSKIVDKLESRNSQSSLSTPPSRPPPTIPSATTTTNTTLSANSTTKLITVHHNNSKSTPPSRPPPLPTSNSKSSLITPTNSESFTTTTETTTNTSSAPVPVHNNEQKEKPHHSQSLPAPIISNKWSNFVEEDDDSFGLDDDDNNEDDDVFKNVKAPKASYSDSKLIHKTPSDLSVSDFTDEESSSDWDDSSSGEDILDAQAHTNEWMDTTRELLLNGLLYLHGCKSKEIEKNEAIAFQYFTKAHEMSHPRGSYKVAEFMYLRSEEESKPYFSQAVDTFCSQTVELVPNSFYGESDFEYMFNDFRNGVSKYRAFYDLITEKQKTDEVKNHVYLKKLILFADTRGKKG